MSSLQASQPSPSSPTAHSSRGSLLIFKPSAWRRMGRNLAYILPGFFDSLVSFIALVTLFSVGISTIIIWVGLPVLIACLACARFFANVDRAALRRWEGEIPPVYYRPQNNRSILGMFKTLGDPQLWRDLLHGGLVAFIYRTTSFSIAVSLLASVLGGLTYWFWQIFLPDDNQGLATLLGLDARFGLDPAVAESLINLIAGILIALLLPAILHGLAAGDAAIARGLLTNQTAALKAQTAQLSQSRAQVVSEGASTLRKIERDLHDGPQQRLIRLQMDVESAKRRMGEDPEGARELMDGALEQSREALAELRALSRGIAPPILADRGLNAALTSLAGQAAVPVKFSSNLPDSQRLPESAENAAYFVASEALANVSKHAEASKAQLSLRFSPTELQLVIDDDGAGGAHVGKGHGLAGLVDRLSGVDGSLTVQSPVGGPTMVAASIPLAASNFSEATDDDSPAIDGQLP